MGTNRFLYHVIKSPPMDRCLYPLNVLREKHRELYERHMQKYTGREHLLNVRIPFWDCLWNDVLFLSAIPPREVLKGIRDAGGHPPPLSFYTFTPEDIQPDCCCVWLFEKADAQDPQQYVPYEPELIERYSVLPPATLAHYRQAIAAGKRPFFHQFVPHFLYRGCLHVGDRQLLSTETSDLDST